MLRFLLWLENIGESMNRNPARVASQAPGIADVHSTPTRQVENLVQPAQPVCRGERALEHIHAARGLCRGRRMDEQLRVSREEGARGASG